MRLIDYFDRGADLFPGRDCLHDGTRGWTYADVRETTHRVANGLLAAGLGKGSKAAVYSPNHASAYAALLGIVRAGVTWAPVNALAKEGLVVRLALQVADRIAGWLRAGARLPGHDDPIRPKDIMILLPRREPFGSAVIRQLKLRGIPVAGADRVRLDVRQRRAGRVHHPLYGERRTPDRRVRMGV